MGWVTGLKKLVSLGPSMASEDRVLLDFYRTVFNAPECLLCLDTSLHTKFVQLKRNSRLWVLDRLKEPDPAHFQVLGHPVFRIEHKNNPSIRLFFLKNQATGSFLERQSCLWLVVPEPFF